MLLLTAYDDAEVRVACVDATERGALIAFNLADGLHWVEYFTRIGEAAHLVFDPNEGEAAYR